MTNPSSIAEANSLVRKGVRLLAGGQRQKALPLLARAIELAPDHAFAHLHLALTLAAEGKDAAARAHLEQALQLRPSNPAFHLFAGRAFFDLGDHSAANREFAKALELHPDNDLARGYRALNDWASGHLEAATELDPQNLPDSTPFLARLLALIESEMRGRSVEYVSDTVRVAALDRPRVAWAFWRANIARKRGEFHEAISHIGAVLELYPGLPAAVAFLSECRADALEAARRRADESPESAQAHLELAAELADAEKFEEAAGELETARRLSDQPGGEALVNSPVALRLASRIAYGLGRIEEALEKARSGAEPGFSMSETHYCLGLCYLALGKRRLCFEEFEKLMAKVYWVAPLRMMEYLAWRQAATRAAESAVRT